jgi:hypothetical protein
MCGGQDGRASVRNVVITENPAAVMSFTIRAQLSIGANVIRKRLHNERRSHVTCAVKKALTFSKPSADLSGQDAVISAANPLNGHKTKYFYQVRSSTGAALI